MGLLDNLFRKKKEADPAGPPSTPSSSQFQESEIAEGQVSTPGSAPRRELVQVVLRDTMRKHGIPTDWVDVRILSVVNRRHAHGMHVQLIVKQGRENLLSYVYAFQDSFMREIEKFEPNASEWLMSIAWQFQGKPSSASPMPDPASWSETTTTMAAVAPQTQAPEEDLHDDVEEDLRALFAIRDAAIKGDPIDDDDPHDFQPTQPGFSNSGKR